MRHLAPTEITVLKCVDVTELATDHMEGALPWRKSLALRLHLAICSFCRRHFRQLRQSVGLLHEMPVPPPDESVEEQILSKLTQE